MSCVDNVHGQVLATVCVGSGGRGNDLGDSLSLFVARTGSYL